MKKLLALLLVLSMAISVVACGKSKPADDESNETEQSVESQEPAEEIDPEITEEKIEEPKEEAEDKKPAEKPSKNPTKDEKPADKPAEEAPAQPAEQTVGTKLLAEFKSKASSGSALSIAEGIANGGSLPFMAGAMEVEPGLLAGFDNAEITGFKSGAVFQPMIGSIAFIGYVFELEDGVSASDFIKTLKDNANLRWNICVEAEEMVTGSVGNKVFFVMCPKAFEE